MHKGAGPNRFLFRGLHPNLRVGTASDPDSSGLDRADLQRGALRRADQDARKTGQGTEARGEGAAGGERGGVFRAFRRPELDFTFYRLLTESDGAPTANYHALRTYREYLREGDRIILKAPQVIFARRLRRTGGFVENDKYLDPDVFVSRFYRPAVDLLGEHLAGIVFEQEYQPKKDRQMPEELAGELRTFFERIPPDSRYHVELRTEQLLGGPVFDMLEKRGVGQVLSHWTWLPPLRKQFEFAGGRFFNSGGECIIRLITPLRVRYEDTYIQAFPFDRMIDGMMSERMVEEAAEIMWSAIDNGVTVNLIANNRVGGNAPLVAQAVVERFLAETKK